MALWGQSFRESCRTVLAETGQFNFKSFTRKVLGSENIFNFYSVRSLFLIVGSLLGAVVINQCDNLPFLASLYFSISAITGSGLAVDSMAVLTTPSLFTLSFLMFFGGSFFLAIPPIAYRQYCYLRKKETIVGKLGPFDNLDGYEELSAALRICCILNTFYLLLFNVGGTLCLYGALFLRPMEPQLVQRNINSFGNAAFLTISAFSNTGLTISSSSVFYHKDNPLAYCILGLLVLAGNTAAPTFLRWMAEIAYYSSECLGCVAAHFHLHLFVDLWPSSSAPPLTSHSRRRRRHRRLLCSAFPFLHDQISLNLHTAVRCSRRINRARLCGS